MFVKDLEGEHYDEKDRGLVALIIFAGALLFFGWGVLYTIPYLDYRELKNKGQVTTAEVLKKSASLGIGARRNISSPTNI